MRGRKKGFNHSLITKEKIRQKRIEFYARGGKATNGMKGKKHKPESLEKMRQINIERGNHKNFGDTSGANNPAWKGGGDKNKRYKKNHPEVEKYNGTKRRAKLLKIIHTISLLEFREWYKITPKICAYCDRNISERTERMRNLSIDRKYNELGYTLENICFACNRCNTVKGNVFTFDQMREIAQKYLKEVITSI
jgi:hypothetical protein